MSDALSTFDITGPLPTGTTLIEASAGTGKTWTLSALVVRYVAEQDRPLSELLIVTFSRAASQELRERVRARLEQTLTALQEGGASDDILIAHLRDCSPDELHERIRRLAAAVADFDTATIATIHQFCHYVLKSLGIAGDSDPYATLAEDLSELRSDVVDDLYVARSVGDPTNTLSYTQAQSDTQIALDNPSAVLSPAAPRGSLATRLEFINAVRAETARRKRRAGVLSYDDLLSELAGALDAEDSPARRRMRDRWSTVLVDEFQDTDPVQWQVFSRAFATEGKTLVLIGDPKQAIYGFRGGDVNTYLRAAETATTRTSLPTNFRSDAPLVDALQNVLADVQLSPGIIARPVKAARQEHRLLDAPDNSPLRIRTMLGNQVPIGFARDAIYADAADDIAALLASDATHDGSPIQPHHIAVLAYANRDLRRMREALSSRGIPSVLISSESVLRTTAAGWWLHLLMALEQPQRAERVRLAALTPFIGWSAADLDAAGERGTDQLAVIVRRLLAAFHRGGVAAVLDAARSAGLDARLLSQVGGERNLTDLQHCAQLLHEQVLAGTTGLPSLVVWLSRQSADDAAATADSRIMRLDSDARAVTLSTIHGSKGLQYPIVYAPFLFDNWMKDDPTPAIIHRDGQRVLSFDAKEVGQPEHRSEALGENMRLAYVAMTRAESQLVLWWAPTRNTANSALHRLLFGQAGTSDALRSLLAARANGAEQAGPTVPADRVSVPNESASEAMLDAWATAVGISVVDTGGERTVPQLTTTLSSTPLSVNTFDQNWVDQAWRRTSYSALTSAQDAAGAATTEPEADVVGRTDEEEIVLDSTGDPGAEVPSPMTGLPASATFGSLVHAVLEHADLQAADLRRELLAQITEQRVRWPVDLDDEVLADALVLACTTPMGPFATDARLVDVLPNQRFAEMDFELPLGGGDTPNASAQLRLIAKPLRESLPVDDPLLPYADVLESAEFGDQHLRGYLTGSVDLTFRRNGRFYVVDYKTNRLGEPGEQLTLGAYAPDKLAEAMNHSSYPLQAILYSVVLHRYLRWRLPGYDPDEHFGGVIYLYLRGMAGPDAPTAGGRSYGVFTWRPPSSLLDDLSAVLVGENAEARS